MSGRVWRLLALAGVLVGLLGGLVVAIAVPRHQTPRSEIRVAGEPQLGKPTPYPTMGNQIILRVHPGTVRLEARRPDPRGGPGWAIRTFLADRVTPAGFRRPGVDPVVGRDRCAQLGRLFAGRFGWIDGRNVFHRVGKQYLGAPLYCGSRRPDVHGGPHMEVATLISDPSRPDAEPLETFVWGIGGPGARRATLDVAGRRTPLAVGGSGTFLAFSGPEVHSRDVRVTFDYAGGGKLTTGQFGADSPSPFAGEPRPTRGEQQIDARAPDPNGGLSWAIASVPSSDGGYCLSQEARVVGDRAGRVDFLLDTLTDAAFTQCEPAPGRAHARLSREHPIALGMSIGGGIPEDGADPAPGRIARRTLRDHSSFSGPVQRDVVSVTIATPRDVRTLVPAGRAHAIIAVYDGTFPTGEVTVTATFRDGSHKVEHIDAGVP